MRSARANCCLGSSEMQSNYTGWRILLRFLAELLYFAARPIIPRISGVFWHRFRLSMRCLVAQWALENAKALLDARKKNRLSNLARGKRFRFLTSCKP